MELVFDEGALYFPLLITACGIFVSFITTFFATHFTTVTMDNIEKTLKYQLVISTILMTGVLIPLSWVALPDDFKLGVMTVQRHEGVACVISGLWSGLIIGYVTEWYTSNQYAPVRELAYACN